MSKIIIVTDSTADLPPDVAATLGITVVPLNVHFADDLFKDGVDITSDSFFSKLTTTDVMPRTSQPSPGDFEEIYRSLVKDAGTGATILSIHISSDMSGTYQSAEMARQILEPQGFDIRVFDSRLVSTALGMMVKTAALAARDGKSADELVALCEHMRDNTRIFFTVDTLEFLEKNGRIGKAQALLGGLLKIKPVLEIRDGVVHPFEKLRGARKVLPRLVELVLDNVPDSETAYVSIMRTSGDERVQTLAEELKGSGKSEDMMIGSIGPVVGCHSGPGALGVSVCPI